MKQYGEGPGPVELSAASKRDWDAFEEYTDLPNEEIKRTCTEWPEILETKAIPATFFPAWGSQASFGGAVHQSRTANFGGDGMFQGLGPDGGDSAQESAGPLSLSSLLWHESNNATPELEMGNAVGNPSYNEITYSGDLSQLRFPTCAPVSMSWSEPDIEIKTENILPILDPDDAAFESKSSIYLGVKADGCPYIYPALDQAASVLPLSITPQSVLPLVPDCQDLSSVLISPNRRGEPKENAPILEETQTRMHGGYAQIDQGRNYRKDPPQSIGAQIPTETTTIDANWGSEDLSNFAVLVDTEIDQPPLSQFK
jgi:hypothetical protein